MVESPIFAQTYDTLLWISNHVSRFPKSERFRLAKRIEDNAFEFYEALMKAAYNQEKQTYWLMNADMALMRLKAYFRLAKDRQLTTLKQYVYASEQLVEVGKLLGGWMKKLA